MQQFDLTPQLAVVDVYGADAGDFLQGQVTGDVLGLTEQAQLMAHCNLKGRMESLFYLWPYGDNHYQLLMPSDLVATAIAKLRRYVLRSAVTIEPRSVSVTGVLAPTASQVVGHGSWQLPDQTNMIRVTDHSTALKLPSASCRYLLVGSESLATEPCLANVSAWFADAIGQNIPWLTAATSGVFLPQDVGLDSLGGISFDKGCFLGQEVVARLHYLGQKKKLPQQVIIAESAEPGEPIYHNERQVGKLICSAKAQSDNHIGLALLPATLANDGSYYLLGQDQAKVTVELNTDAS